mgnify:CR=1 FL=1
MKHDNWQTNIKHYRTIIKFFGVKKNLNKLNIN